MDAFFPSRFRYYPGPRAKFGLNCDRSPFDGLLTVSPYRRAKVTSMDRTSDQWTKSFLIDVKIL